MDYEGLRRICEAIDAKNNPPEGWVCVIRNRTETIYVYADGKEIEFPVTDDPEADEHRD